MTGLREHFAETADGAKHYDVTETVVRRARRHRVVAQVVGAATAVLVAGSAAVVLTNRPAPAPAVTEIDATRPPQPGRLDWLPATFAAVDPQRLPDLPTGRDVGEGALVYRRNWVTALLTSDGKSYRVPGDVRGLSPDGRWLAYRVDDRLVLRSLVDGRTQTFSYTDLTGWSVDGTQAVLTSRMPDGRPPAVATVYRPDDGAARTVRVPDPAWWAPRGLSADGDLLLMPRRLTTATFDAPATTAPPEMPTTAPTQTSATEPPLPRSTEEPAAPAGTLAVPPSGSGFGIGFVDPVDQSARSVTVLAERIGADDPVEWNGGVDQEISVRADTGGLMFQPLRAVQDEFRVYAPGDLFEVDPATGRPVRHFRLPPVTGRDPSHLRLLGTAPEGFLLDASDDGPWTQRLEVLDPLTGDRRTVLRLPDEIMVDFVRGGRPY